MHRLPIPPVYRQIQYERFWKHYRPRVAGLARRLLAAYGSSMADEEDIAQEVFIGLFDQVADGRHGDVGSEYNLWPLLLVMTRRTTREHIKRLTRIKRGGKLHRREFVSRTGDDQILRFVEVAPDSRPRPDILAASNEMVARLLAQLEDVELRNTALLKLDGYTDAEAAGMLSCARSTVANRLQKIRRIWSAYRPVPPRVPPRVPRPVPRWAHDR